ncbi:BA14K family protein [Rhizobium helianthi]|uniref:Lectin-like protein BA14k n=1 Tax=Rhizobium helianthi TaxID=1132695 RepID=A0ABW4M6Q0_9HYPH
MFSRKLAVIATTLAVALTGVAPAQAMPAVAVSRVQASGEAPVVTVQWDRRDARRWDRRHDRRWDRRHDRRWDRRGHPNSSSGYYNGYRGYRERRSGYRYHNGYWFPLAAFAAGAIIGGATAAPRAVAPAGRYSARHYAWCQQRYKTYRASDNTFVANSRGERRYCNSPY